MRKSLAGGSIHTALNRSCWELSERNTPNEHPQRERFAPLRLIIALLLPWLTFFTIGRPLAGVVCLILQVTLIGWLPAAIWAVYALSQFKTDQKIQRALGRSTY
jgi:hypothetical protein